ncbi:RNA polymerase sigma24 factor [Streptomyces viridiviolaceus]|nr:RNA polymerase sigma24 factor [Streptomyces viridiviolaceus]
MPANDPELNTALTQAQCGDETAFAALHRLLQPGLLGYLHGIVGEGAEDIAAAAWREIARDLPRFRGDGQGLRGWTASITRRHALQHLRRRDASVRSAEGDLPEVAATSAPARVMLSAESARAVLARLPRPQAEAVLLRHAILLDERAVARVMRRPRPVVRVLTRRGMGSLARLLGSEEVPHAVARSLGEPR